MQPTGVPSVEEILDAIKQVIARDNRSATQANAATPDGDGEAFRPRGARGQDDVLDLASLENPARDTKDETGPSDSLLTADVRNSMRESLAALAMISEPRAQPQIVRSGETSLEGLVQDLLRPALTQWLDCNLPALVERLVAAEIARIVGKKS